jgi:hypothetical protein
LYRSRSVDCVGSRQGRQASDADADADAKPYQPRPSDETLPQDADERSATVICQRLGHACGMSKAPAPPKDSRSIRLPAG